MERLPVTVAENRSLQPVSLAANPEGIAAGVERPELLLRLLVSAEI